MDEESEKMVVEIKDPVEESQEEIIINLHRCHWCNKEEEEEHNFQEVNILRKGDEDFNVYVCSSEHESRINKSYNYFDKIYILGIILIFLAPIIFVALTILVDIIYIYPVFVAIGLGLLIYPLFSQQIVRALGLQKSNILGRILGTIIVLLGIVLFLIDVLNVPV